MDTSNAYGRTHGHLQPCVRHPHSPSSSLPTATLLLSLAPLPTLASPQCARAWLGLHGRVHGSCPPPPSPPELTLAEAPSPWPPPLLEKG